MAFSWAFGMLERLARLGIEPHEVMHVLAYGKRASQGAHAGRDGTDGPGSDPHRARAAGGAVAGSLGGQITAARELRADEEAELRRWEATR